MATNPKAVTLMPDERVVDKIFLIRGKKVMIDRDLADLYRVETRILVRNVKRHIDRFPKDFMFQLSAEEWEVLRSQIGTSKIQAGRGGRRYAPYVFTEQGVAMLSSVLNSKTAIQVNIQIMRNFVRLRQLLATNEQLARKLSDMEKRYDSQFKQVFRVITKLMLAETETKRGSKLGFVQDKGRRP